MTNIWIIILYYISIISRKRICPISTPGGPAWPFPGPSHLRHTRSLSSAPAEAASWDIPNGTRALRTLIHSNTKIFACPVTCIFLTFKLFEVCDRGPRSCDPWMSLENVQPGTRKPSASALSAPGGHDAQERRETGAVKDHLRCPVESKSTVRSDPFGC